MRVREVCCCGYSSWFLWCLVSHTWPVSTLQTRVQTSTRHQNTWWWCSPTQHLTLLRLPNNSWSTSRIKHSLHPHTLFSLFLMPLLHVLEYWFQEYQLVFPTSSQLQEFSFRVLLMSLVQVLEYWVQESPTVSPTSSQLQETLFRVLLMYQDHVLSPWALESPTVSSTSSQLQETLSRLLLVPLLHVLGSWVLDSSTVSPSSSPLDINYCVPFVPPSLLYLRQATTPSHHYLNTSHQSRH